MSSIFIINYLELFNTYIKHLISGGGYYYGRDFRKTSISQKINVSHISFFRRLTVPFLSKIPEFGNFLSDLVLEIFTF